MHTNEQSRRGPGRAAAAHPADPQADPAYALPRSDEEYQRLSRQAAFLKGTTKRLFRAAGLRPGMRVLDVGSGAGDVAFLAADLVGPGGKVVGIDVDGAALAVARGRAQALGLPNVTFIEGDARTAEVYRDFDAVVGRLVLMYWTDPAGSLRRISARVRPGGVLAFQELDMDPAAVSQSYPDETLWNQTSHLITETFARAGMQMRMGRQLHGAFVAAGLPAPHMRDEAITGAGPDFEGYAWLAGVARSLAPLTENFGIADADKLGSQTLSGRLREDAITTSAVVWTPRFIGACERKPAL